MRIAVTGSTGKLGSQVVDLLAATAAHEVLALARRPGARTSEAIVPTYAAYDDLASLRSALRGIDVLVFVSSDGDAARMMVHHQNVVRAATDNQVPHIVYLSGVDADLDSPFCYAYTNGYTEQLLASSGCAVSVARASIYIEFFQSFLRPARASGQLRLPAGDGRISLVSRTDVGRCLAILAASPPTGRHHDITGPESLSLDAVGEAASHAWNSRVLCVDVPPETFVAELASSGEDPWWTYAYSTMLASVREQRWNTVSDEVHRLTGQAPLSLADVLDSRHSKG